jgi:hypothetical protein
LKLGLTLRQLPDSQALSGGNFSRPRSVRHQYLRTAVQLHAWQPGHAGGKIGGAAMTFNDKTNDGEWDLGTQPDLATPINSAAKPGSVTSVNSEAETFAFADAEGYQNTGSGIEWE